MDQFSQRATIEAIREHCGEGNLTPDWAKSVLDQYEDLTDMAKDVARVVWSIRWPRSGYEPSFEINFGEEYRDQKRHVSAGFYMHQANDSFDFPFEYLFMDFDQILTAEDIRKDEQHRAEQAKRAALVEKDRERLVEKDRERDLATLRRLKEQYPDA